MTDIKKLEARLLIDEHALEQEWKEQPDLFYKVAQGLALAISARDEAKLILEETEADTAINLRQAAAAADEKITDKTVESRVKVDVDVEKVARRFLDYKKEASDWTILKEAYEQRSYALSNLVELHLGNYYSSQGSNPKPRGPGALRDIKDAKAEEVKQVMRGVRNAVSAGRVRANVE